MEQQWKGKSYALVTGASGGIGSEICRKLAQHGITVMGCGNLHFEKLETLAKELEKDPDVIRTGGKLEPRKCDLRKEEDIKAIFKEIESRYERLDICINNAGVIECAPLIDGDVTKWTEMMEVNVLATCACTRHALKLMTGTKGVIIQMGCIGGHKIASIPKNVADPGVSFYNGTKSMVRALASGLRQELKAKNVTHIRVSTISPGPVETDMLKKVKDFLASDSKKPATSTLPAEDESLKPEEIASAVIYILSCPEKVNVDDIVVQNVAFSL